MAGAFNLEPYIPKNPSLPMFQVKLDGVQLELSKPEHCISFEYNFNGSGSGSNFSMVLFDEHWLDIETKLRDAKDGFEVRWGYANGAVNRPEGKSWSKWHKCFITEYNPEFTSHGMTLSISGVSDEVVTAARISRTHTYKEKTIEEVIKIICLRNKWNVVVEPTVTIFRHDNVTSKEPVKKTWNQNKMTDLYFIKYVLLPKATASTKGGYKCYFDETINTLYFRPPPQEPSFVRYIFMREKLGVVKAFAPEVQGLSVFAQAGGKKTQAIFFDPVKRKVGKAEMDNQTTTVVSGGVTTTEKSDKLNNTGKETEAPTETEQGDAEKIIPTVAQSKEEAKAQTEQEFISLYNYSYIAKLEIIGDPTMDKSVIDKYIDVVLTLEDGKLYYLSGKFIINGFTHSISAGEYTTTLNISKNATLKGTIRPSGTRPNN